MIRTNIRLGGVLMYTYTHLEDFIRQVYQKLNVQEPQQLNLRTISDSLNIGIHSFRENSQVLLFEGKYYIFLDARLTDPKQFEELGHELGHVLLHAADQQHINIDYRLYQEWKANLFALHFCVPTFMLQKLQSNQLNPYTISDLFGVTVDFACKRLTLHQQKVLQYQSLKLLQRSVQNA